MNQIDKGSVPRLAVYGTLAPGQPNHGQLAHLSGQWFPGVVRGFLHNEGWGAELGYPGIVLDQNGDEVNVQILESASLATEWQRLDAFEGPGYRRVVVEAHTSTGSVTAQIYVLATSPSRNRPV